MLAVWPTKFRKKCQLAQRILMYLPRRRSVATTPRASSSSSWLLLQSLSPRRTKQSQDNNNSVLLKKPTSSFGPTGRSSNHYLEELTLLQTQPPHPATSLSNVSAPLNQQLSPASIEPLPRSILPVSLGQEAATQQLTVASAMPNTLQLQSAIGQMDVPIQSGNSTSYMPVVNYHPSRLNYKSHCKTGNTLI